MKRLHGLSIDHTMQAIDWSGEWHPWAGAFSFFLVYVAVIGAPIFLLVVLLRALGVDLGPGAYDTPHS